VAQHALELESELHAERIELGRTIERYDADLAVDLVEHALFAHVHSPVSRLHAGDQPACNSGLSDGSGARNKASFTGIIHGRCDRSVPR
jgi:hypothetical protein